MITPPLGELACAVAPSMRKGWPCTCWVEKPACFTFLARYRLEAANVTSFLVYGSRKKGRSVTGNPFLIPLVCNIVVMASPTEDAFMYGYTKKVKCLLTRRVCFSWIHGPAHPAEASIVSVGIHFSHVSHQMCVSGIGFKEPSLM